MKAFKILLVLTFLSGLCIKSNAQITLDSIPDGAGYTYIASPNGSGPFPAVLYNHGGLDTVVGGDLRGTVIALASAGYLARAEKRMETPGIMGHLEEVEAALDSLLADPRADTTCVSIMGFSRGGYLTLEAAKANPLKVNAVIAMAPANPAGLLNTLVMDVSPIDDPVLLMVAQNDTIQGAHVEWVEMTYDSLISAGKIAYDTIYPDYDSNGNSLIDPSDDGHLLFFEVLPLYWQDVLNFLNTNACSSLTIDDVTEHPGFKVYPNPSASTIIVEIDHYTEPYTIIIYNLFGQKIYSTRIKEQKGQIQLPNAPGIYLVEVRKINEVYVKKVMKE